jgi:hypothetical protein
MKRTIRVVLWSVLALAVLTAAQEQAVANGHPGVVDALLRKGPGLRLGNGPRAWAIRGLAWVQGHSDVLAQLDRPRNLAVAR